MVLTEVQSSFRIPPVSPELGFQDQNVQLMLSAPYWAVGRRYCASALSHFWSTVDCRVVPNSPTQTGAMFWLNR